MGAEFNFAKLHAKTPEEAIKKGNALIDQAAYDYGHAGYTGSFAECTGVVFNHGQFDTVDDAENWLVDHAEKWGPMIVVKVKDDFVAGAWCSA